VVEFTVYLPNLLDSGQGGNHDVEIHAVDPSEPIDIRRNRQLTIDNMRLNRELVINFTTFYVLIISIVFILYDIYKDKLKSQISETDAIRRELKLSRVKLEEEQKTRLKIEQQLDQHNEKV